MIKVVDALIKAVPSESNVFVSPLSIDYALRMLQEGATVNSEHSEALQELISFSDDVTLPEEIMIANSLWIRGESVPEVSYGRVLKEKFQAIVEALPETAKPINNFITTKTKGLIGPIIDDSICRNPLTRALIVNVIYFKGVWAQAFDKTKTKNGIFNQKQTVPFMHIEGKFSTKKNEQFTSVAMEYTSALRAVFVLPHDDVPAESLRLVDWNTQVRPVDHPTKIQIELPRFSVDFGTDLLPAIFEAYPPATCLRDKDNGFLRISNAPDLHLSSLIHQATCSIDEDGTVAAAATVAVMKTRSISIRPVPLLRFDRPFWFAIESKEDGALFFIGLIRTIVPPTSPTSTQ